MTAETYDEPDELDDDDDQGDDDESGEGSYQAGVEEGIRRARCTCHDTHARSCGSYVRRGGLLRRLLDGGQR